MNRSRYQKATMPIDYEGSMVVSNRGVGIVGSPIHTERIATLRTVYEDHEKGIQCNAQL